MTSEETFDVVVIGGGPVGENVVDRAGRTGLSVALVEAELVGGECSYWACMPSKVLLRPGAALEMARRVPGLRVDDAIDPGPVLSRRDWMTADWDDAGQEKWLKGVGAALIRGLGRLTGERTVEVVPAEPDANADQVPSVRRLKARYAVVASTGSLPVLPDTPGLAEVNPWTSREATSASEIPASLAIIGGGVVAAEMAFAFHDLGAEVTVLSRGPLLNRFEPWAGEAVTANLRALGVRVLDSATVRRVWRSHGEVVLDTDSGESIHAERLLVATGRTPRTADLGVDTVGLVPGEPLRVDDTLCVRGVPGQWLYAAGDVTGRAATTHQGKYQARVAGDVIAARFGVQTPGAPTSGDEPPQDGESATPWSRYTATADSRAATQAVFTRPEVAAVGLTEAAARKAGTTVRTVSYDLGSVAGAEVLGEDYTGKAMLVIDDERRVVVGATFVGPDAAEMLHAATIAVVGEVPLERLWHTVPAYPTVSEVWLRLLEGYGL